MVDIPALMRALPVSGLEPSRMAFIGGFVEAPKGSRWQGVIELLEPPAGGRVPYIEPVQALEKLLRRQSVAPEGAGALARVAVRELKEIAGASCWVNFYDDLEPMSPDCLPLPDFTAWLRRAMLVPPDVTDFLERAAEVAAAMPMFQGPDNRDDPWSLADLPALLPKAMIEFVPGPPWATSDWDADSTRFLAWREAIRPIALALERKLGEPVYYFADLDDDLDDDDVHRFLVLHWCCTHKPDSAFVQYLVAASEARDVEELKTALIDPDSYTQPFKMNAFEGMGTLSCHFDYVAPDVRKTVAVVFSTPEAREVAQALLAQKIGAHACVIAPKTLATDEWVEHATRHCRGWEVRYVHDQNLAQPVEILASIDELCVIANEKPTRQKGLDLRLSDTVEDLLALALDLGVEATYLDVDRTRLWNPETSLEARGVPERLAARQARRAAFTGQLTELRLGNDYGSSGLWDEHGRELGYDLLDLPFSLVKRIAAWQRDFEERLISSDEGDDAWWERHTREEVEIAGVLQAAFKSRIAVKVHRNECWLPIDSLNSSMGGNSGV
jgi:hypothetical protein